MLILQNISYTHPNGEPLFENITLTLNRQEKIGLVGNNGSGKTTLLRILAGQLQPAAGRLEVAATPYFVPQIYGQFNHLTIAQAMGIETKRSALQAILSGRGTQTDYALLDDDWTLEERTGEALEKWQLTGLDLSQQLSVLSGGQKTKIFLAGMSIHRPAIILLDEPSNHLDEEGRQGLYDFVQSTHSTMVVVSHDRKLLNLLPATGALHAHGLTAYGGNYDFYAAQKQLEQHALQQELHSTEKALRKAKEKERETVERQQKLDSRGKGKQEKAGVAKIMMNTLRNSAEQSTARIKSVHAAKIGSIAQELKDLRAALPDIDRMKLGFDDAQLHTGKVLFTAQDLNHGYGAQLLWPQNLNFEIRSGERIALKGHNGSGKTTLLQILLNLLAPQKGTVYRAFRNWVYVDQEYSLVAGSHKVFEQAMKCNTQGLQEHEVKIRLNWFLFGKNDWDKPCNALSGGEKMRLLLCCLTLSQQAPDLIVLDEPTNNLDMQNMIILTQAINSYQGTLITVSHDDIFLQETGMERTIRL